jgi:hypothetical protein
VCYLMMKRDKWSLIKSKSEKFDIVSKMCNASLDYLCRMSLNVLHFSTVNAFTTCRMRASCLSLLRDINMLKLAFWCEFSIRIMQPLIIVKIILLHLRSIQTKSRATSWWIYYSKQRLGNVRPDKVDISRSPNLQLLVVTCIPPSCRF